MNIPDRHLWIGSIMAAKASNDSISVFHAVTIQRAGDEDAARAMGLGKALEAWPIEEGWSNHDASVVNLHIARTAQLNEVWTDEMRQAVIARVKIGRSGEVAKTRNFNC